jgi:hypothetical protein
MTPDVKHFKTFVTTDKLCSTLDSADEQGLTVVVAQFLGGRDWLIVTYGSPILGPALSGAISARKD